MTHPSAVAILQGQFAFAHTWLNGAFEDCSDQVALWRPEPPIAPIIGQYLHAVTSEDYLVHELARGGASVFAAQDWGFSFPPAGAWLEWAQSLRISVAKAKAYAEAVFADTERYLTAIPEADLFAELDASAINVGMTPRWDVLNLALVDLHSHCGEIAVIKGLQGLRGYMVV